GCSVFEPYVDIPQLQIGSGEPFTNLRSAIVDMEKQRTDNVKSRRDEQVIIRNSLGLITFGSAAGAGGAALFGAHRNTVLGLGIAAAASYTGGTLFFGPERSRLYSAANQTLYCIAIAGYGAVSAAETIEMQTTKGAYEKTKAQIDNLL